MVENKYRWVEPPIAYDIEPPEVESHAQYSWTLFHMSGIRPKVHLWFLSPSLKIINDQSNYIPWTIVVEKKLNLVTEDKTCVQVSWSIGHFEDKVQSYV